MKNILCNHAGHNFAVYSCFNIQNSFERRTIMCNHAGLNFVVHNCFIVKNSMEWKICTTLHSKHSESETAFHFLETIISFDGKLQNVIREKQRFIWKKMSKIHKYKIKFSHLKRSNYNVVTRCACETPCHLRNHPEQQVQGHKLVIVDTIVLRNKCLTQRI